MKDIEEIRLYRMTHLENIQHILQYGITHKNSSNANPNYKTIGDLSLIDNRSTKQVKIDNGDFLNCNAPSIILGDFIPFYFGLKMPMLYVIQHGGNFVEEITTPENVVYLVSTLSKLIESNITFYFSDGHATDNFSSFYDASKITDLNKIIDWTAIKTQYWAGQEILDLKRKKQAELLVKGDLPPDFLFAFGCYNEAAKNKLILKGIPETKIKVINNSYF